MTAPPVGKVPIYFGTNDRPLFGFYHPPRGNVRRAMGVILLNPIGDDLIRAHRTFRHLAEALATAGFPVLRFDFDGAGDSAGDERDADRVATWRADVGRAAAELRARSGERALALVGLKLGATFAMLGAQDLGGVDALVMWGAYETGGTFVSDVTKAHKMHTMLEPMSFSGGPPSSEGAEALGYLISPQTADDLAKVDLNATTVAPAKRVFVIDAGNVAGPGKLAEHLTQLGCDVTRRHMPGHKFLITTPHHSEVPTAVIEAVTSWLGEGVATSPAAAGDAAAAASAPAPAESSLGERAVYFGPGANAQLFGIWARPPSGSARADVPAIIMTNAGTVHRIGAHRTYVGMARRWAQMGFHVLRVDLSGIGDSPVPEGCTENITYPRDRLEDMRAAMDFLTAQTGIRRFVVTGLCSGGDIAFQLGVKEPRVATSIMINPRTFLVHDLSLVDSYQTARWYQGSLLRKESWVKLLRGDVDVKRALRLVGPKVRDVVVNRAKRAVDTLMSARGGGGGGGAGGAETPRETEVPKCLRVMAERGVDTFLLVAEHDPGVDYIDANYGSAMRALASLPGYRRVDLKGTDHTFTARWAQERVADMITDHLKQRYLSSRAA